MGFFLLLFFYFYFLSFFLFLKDGDEPWHYPDSGTAVSIFKLLSLPHGLKHSVKEIEVKRNRKGYIALSILCKQKSNSKM